MVEHNKPGMKKMTYETYKHIDSQPKKERPEFKQSKHDYTIRSEWGAEAFEFWWWKKDHKTNRTTTLRDEHNKPGVEEKCHELTDTPKKITRLKIARSDLERISSNGTHFESNLEM